MLCLDTDLGVLGSGASGSWIALTTTGEFAFSDNGVNFTKSSNTFSISAGTPSNTVFWHAILQKWLFIAGDSGVTAISDGGTVTNLNNPSSSVNAIQNIGYNSVANRIMACGNTTSNQVAVWYSDDNFSTWSSSKVVRSGTGIARNVQHNGGSIWTCTDGEDLFISTDGGDNWSKVVDNTGSLTNPAKNMYAGNTSAYVFCSSSAGKIWTSANGSTYSEITPNNGVNNWGGNAAKLTTAYDSVTGKYLIASDPEENSGTRTIGYSTTPATANSWTLKDSPSATGAFLRTAAAKNGVFLLGGSLNSGNTPRLIGSSDGGVNWAVLTQPFTSTSGNRIDAIGVKP